MMGACASILALLTVYLFFMLKSTIIQTVVVGGVAFLAVAGWLIVHYREWLINNLVKVFLVLFVIGFNTPAVTGVSHLELTDIVLMVGFLVFLISVMTGKSDLHITGLDYANFFLLTALALPIMHSVFNILLVILLIKSFLLSFLITNFCVRRENLLLLIKGMIVFAIISALVGIAQELIYQANGYLLTGFIETQALQKMFEDTSFGKMFRVPGLTDSYKTLCFMLLLVSFIILPYILSSDVSRNKKLSLSVAFLIIVSGFVLTFSNDGMLTFFVIFSLALAYKFRRFALHGLVLGIGLFVLIVVVDKHYALINSIYNELHQGEFRGRLHLDRGGVYGFLFKNTWTGVGADAYKYTGHFYKWAAHNNFILAADQAGVLGVTALFSLIAYAVYRAVTLNLLDLQACDRPLAAGLLLSLLAIVMLLQFHSGYVVSHLWLLMGMIQAMYLGNQPKVDSSARIDSPTSQARRLV